MRHRVPPRPGDDEESTRKTFVFVLLFMVGLVTLALLVKHCAGTP